METRAKETFEIGKKMCRLVQNEGFRRTRGSAAPSPGISYSPSSCDRTKSSPLRSSSTSGGPVFEMAAKSEPSWKV